MINLKCAKRGCGKQILSKKDLVVSFFGGGFPDIITPYHKKCFNKFFHHFPLNPNKLIYPRLWNPITPNKLLFLKILNYLALLVFVVPFIVIIYSIYLILRVVKGNFEISIIMVILIFVILFYTTIRNLVIINKIEKLPK